MALLRYIWAKLQSPSSSLSNPSKFQTMLVTRPWLKGDPPCPSRLHPVTCATITKLHKLRAGVLCSPFICVGAPRMVMPSLYG